MLRFLIIFVITLNKLNTLVIKDNSDFIRLYNLPNKQLEHNDIILISYSLSHNIGGLELALDFDLFDHVVYSKIFNTSQTKRFQVEMEKIVIKFPYQLRCRPDLLNNKYFYQNKIFIRLWMLNRTEAADKSNFYYKDAKVKTEYSVKLVDPYSRSSKIEKECLSFGSEILFYKELKNVYYCDLEQEKIHIITNPLPLNGKHYGKVSEFMPYTDVFLEANRLKSFSNFRFSILLWIYIEEYCKSSFCSIYQRYDSYLKRYTPNIFITNKGNIIVEIYNSRNAPNGAKTMLSLPLKQWCRLIFNFTNKKWTLYVNCKNDFTKALRAENYIDFDVVYNDVEAYVVVGGSIKINSFNGLIGKLTVFRNRLIDLKTIDNSLDNDMMFKIYDDKSCKAPLKKLHFLLKIKEIKKKSIIKKKSCENNFLELISNVENKKQNDFCSIYSNLDNFSSYLLDQLIKLKESNPETIGQHLFQNMIQIIRTSQFNNFTNLIETLKICSCLNIHESNYVLSVLYSNGFGVELNEELGKIYLIKAAKHGDRLSLLALGHNHFYGLDGFTIDYDQSYYYYRQISEIAKDELYNPKSNENFPFNVRLSEKNDLETVVTENSEIFNWLKYQAKNGIVSAQNKLSTLFYWGIQGVKRNIKAGIQFFKKGAEKNDPEASFSYGLALAKGKGVEKNTKLGIEYLEKSAKLGSSRAFAALGHYAYQNEKNVTKALIYWLEGWEKYKDVDCAFNLGYFWSEGLYFNQRANLKKAWEFWSYAATKGQIDSQIKVADFNSRGYGVIPRNAKLAATWARTVGEKSSVLGKYLHEGLLAYREQNWKGSILFYLMTAYAGLEISSFNLAFLCEEIDEIHLMKIDCITKYYNQSINSNLERGNSYAYVKMGDYFYEKGRKKFNLVGYNSNEINKALEYYSLAFQKGNPQGLFNIAFLIENGYHVSAKTFERIGFPELANQTLYNKLNEIYKSCLMSEHLNDGFLPCSINFFKNKIKFLFNYYYSTLVLFVFPMVAMFAVVIFL
ncbi:unnamed protein product [Brachionus calyciflorus]|uniref:Uncharacterized protein n=1 Tax=Brachionus calyciflorus TaxID=104777 RepID=A0A813M5X5_9BILA|nr:unnamed protein product [Brachionus calyciflorus]